MKKFETERLLLQEISIKDGPFILKLYNSPKFIEFIGDRNLRTIEDAEEYITTKFLPQLEKVGFGNYLIREKSDQKKIGAVGIFVREGMEVTDIGFSFLDEYQGQGYAFEAATKIMAVGFNDFGLSEIAALTSKENTASQNLIKKLGLKYIKNTPLPDDPEELLYFEIKKSEWEENLNTKD